MAEKPWQEKRLKLILDFQHYIFRVLPLRATSSRLISQLCCVRDVGGLKIKQHFLPLIIISFSTAAHVQFAAIRYSVNSKTVLNKKFSTNEVNFRANYSPLEVTIKILRDTLDNMIRYMINFQNISSPKIDRNLEILDFRNRLLSRQSLLRQSHR